MAIATAKRFLVKQLTGARTLPANFYNKLSESLKSRFETGNIMEVVDKNRISQVKVASVHEVIGKRLHVKYYDSSPEDNGFWCHEDSPLIHPVGWAFRVGHPLAAPQPYLQRVATGRLLPNDSTPDMFYQYPATDAPLFSEGMKLEAIDPLNLSSICAATVMQILNEGYMMIRIDYYPAEASGADWFCYHQRSPCIFPVGFAAANNITLIPPSGFSAEAFRWEQYLGAGAAAAGRGLFAARGHVVSHGFVKGMRLECADLMDPRLVCVATIARVVADLLKVHFDGWGEEYDQWLWAHSPDVYPVGWSRAVGHRLEGPLQPRAPRPPKAPRRAKRRKRPTPSQTSHPPTTMEDSSQNSDVAETKSLSPLTTASEASADVDTRHSTHSDVTGDVDTRHSTHSDVTGDVDTRHSAHSDVTADVDTRHSVTSDLTADVDTRHSTISDVTAEFDTRHSTTIDVTVDVDTRHSVNCDATAEMDTRHSTTSDVTADTRHSGNSDVTADVDTRPSTISDATADNKMELDHKDDNSSDTNTSDQNMDSVCALVPRLGPGALPAVRPLTWTPRDVARFLTVNDCQPYCENFAGITGPQLLQLSKDEIIELLQMKVGPSLKIYDLIQQLKVKIKQPNRLCR